MKCYLKNFFRKGLLLKANLSRVFYFFYYKVNRRIKEARFEKNRWNESLQNPSLFYLDCHAFFLQGLPAEIVSHRKYFKRFARGFGEDAFHCMWFFLFREFQPANFLEIGVYRGQILSLASLLARYFNLKCDVTGISPFRPIGDSVSRYSNQVDYLNDTYSNFRFFNLPRPNLHRAFSTDPSAVSLIFAKQWDLIYIDGNHDYAIAKADWQICSSAVKKGGLVVLDDSALSTCFKPPFFSTAGHPGPSQVAGEIQPQSFREILQVGHNRIFQRIS